MHPILKVAEMFLASLPIVEPTADGAVDPRVSYVKLDGTSATRQMTLADASSANGMNRKIIAFEAVDVSNTVDLDFNDPTGAKTWTPVNAGEMLILVGSDAGEWNVIVGTNIA